MTKPTTPPWRRAAFSASASIAAVLAGAILTLCLLELGLRLAGFVAARRPPVPESGWTVLCLGDSFTYTAGGDSYPDQLAHRLTAGGVQARVINRGVNGMNSNQLADRIDGELDRWRPDVAIVLVGADNFWSSLPIREEPRLRRLDRTLLTTRTWKLFKLLWIGIAEGTLRTRYRAERAPRDRREALETVRLALDRLLEHPDDWYRAQLGDPPEAPRVEAAVEALAARVAAEPEDSESRVVLGNWRLEAGDARGAEQTFRGGLATPFCRPLPAIYAGLAKALERTRGEAAARLALEDASRGGRCRVERRMAEAEWRLWRGEPAAAAAILRAVAREKPGDADIWRMLGETLYAVRDYDGSIAAFREHSRRLAPGQAPGNEFLAHALLRKWEVLRAKNPGAPPPQANAVDIAYTWAAAGEWGRCAEAVESRLRAEPLASSLFYTYATCLHRAGRYDEIARLAVEV
ncbi:MAG: hypothetical protein HZB91_00510, partial [Elusimicrobia bacterium]|nr:hypothetical protein [Elusimicrobiota bacterium]